MTEKRWVHHFREALKRTEPGVLANSIPSDEIDINPNPPTHKDAIKALENGEAPGIDTIHAEILIAGAKTCL